MKYREWVLDAGDSINQGPEIEGFEVVPVIEKSAYDDLLAKAEKLIDTLRLVVDEDIDTSTDGGMRFIKKALAAWEKK